MLTTERTRRDPTWELTSPNIEETRFNSADSGKAHRPNMKTRAKTVPLTHQ